MLGISTVLTAYILSVAFLLGSVFGSFMNCAAWRIAHGENWMKGRSHCAVCGHSLGIPDLVPILSYVLLRGRCRYCGEKISPRYMLTELLTGALFVGIVWQYDVSGLSLRYLGWIVLLLGLSLVDLETYEIPDGFLISGIMWWILTMPLIAVRGEMGIMSQLRNGLLGGFVIAAAILVISLIFEQISGKEAMGGGDIKLYFVTGLYLSLPLAFLNVMLSCMIGLIFVAGSRRTKIPFGPSISIATYLVLLIGQPVVDWYLSLF